MDWVMYPTPGDREREPTLGVEDDLIEHPLSPVVVLSLYHHHELYQLMDSRVLVWYQDMSW